MEHTICLWLTIDSTYEIADNRRLQMDKRCVFESQKMCAEDIFDSPKMARIGLRRSHQDMNKGNSERRQDTVPTQHKQV
jgi:hypothetical protein